MDQAELQRILLLAAQAPGRDEATRFNGYDASSSPQLSPAVAAHYAQMKPDPLDEPVGPQLPQQAAQELPPPKQAAPAAPPAAPAQPSSSPSRGSLMAKGQVSETTQKYGYAPEVNVGKAMQAYRKMAGADDEAGPFGKETKDNPIDYDAKRLQDADKLRRRLGLAEGLDQLGRSLAGLSGHTNPNKIPPVDMTDLKQHYSKADRKLTGAEKSMLEAHLGPIAADMDPDKIRELLPLIGNQLNSKRQAEIAGYNQRRGDERFATNQTRLNEAHADAQDEKLYRAKERVNQQYNSFAKKSEENEKNAQVALEGLLSGDVQRQKMALTSLARASGDSRFSNEDRIAMQTPLGGLPKIKAYGERVFLNQLDDSVIKGAVAAAEALVKAEGNYRKKKAKDLARQNARPELPAWQLEQYMTGEMPYRPVVGPNGEKFDAPADTDLSTPEHKGWKWED
jgi:hypothetical protein